jgi:MFS-type transporter involved in bile tolerance (Atg22 family)
MAWLVMSSTGLALSASALVVARALPGAVFTLFAGGAADLPRRLEPERICVVIGGLSLEAMAHREFGVAQPELLVSALGDWIGVIVMPLYVLDMTGQALSVAILMACRVLPSIILGPVAGTLIDRSNKRVLMMVADAVRGLLYIALVFVSSEWQVYALTILLATASTVFQPALRSYMPQIVDGVDS